MKPCKECPFSKRIAPGALGGSPPEVYIGQSVLPFWLPCHCSKNYAGKQSDVNKVTQCAGAAMLRGALVRERGLQYPESLLVLEPTSEVFNSLAEFYAHHSGCSVEAAEQYLAAPKVLELALREWTKPEVQVQLKRKQ